MSEQNPFISNVDPATEIAVAKKDIEYLKEGIKDIKESSKILEQIKEDVNALKIFEMQSRELKIPKRVADLETQVSSDRKYFSGGLGVLTLLGAIAAWVGWK